MSRTTRRLVALSVAAALTIPAPAVAAAGEGAGGRDTHRDGAQERRANVTIQGRGYGHGRGMSQWGAQNRAAQGQSWMQIVRFYYPGTAIGSKGGGIKVEITGDTSRRDTIVLDRSGLKIKSLKSGRSWKPRKNADRWRIKVKGGKSVVSYRKGTWHTWRSFGGDAQFSAGGRPLTLLKAGGRTAYRGKLRNTTVGGHRATVNVLPLDQYLKGVVPTEVPASWPRHAVRAQSVAARTYAAFLRADRGVICDTTACQVYGGYSAEHADSNAAVKATRKRVLLYRGAPAFTEFSASNGGWTAQGTVHGSTVSYLPEKQDTFDTMYKHWSVNFTGREVTRHWPGMGTLQGITVTQRDGNGGQWGGRALRVRVEGSNFDATVSGETFRSYLGLRSTWIAVS